ncbi:MAG: HAMP domain-containing histidine kinase [Cytophagales bacterium]|nr:HAMP domain-containing histidine kinase [Cytophagales bacterium]
MTQNTLKWIIVLMVITLTGLISFQMYWINNAINVSEDRFKKGVQDALNTTSDQLERQEIVYTAANKLHYSQEGKNWIGLDSITFISKKRRERAEKGFLLKEEDVKKFYFAPDSIAGDQERLIVDIETDQPFKSSEGAWIDEDMSIEIKRFKANIDSVIRFDTSTERNIKKVEEKQEMVTVVLNELFSKERKLENRIDKNQLQHLLQSSLQNQGIDIDFDYGVIDGSEKRIVLTNTSENQEEVLNSEFRTDLFTRDIIPTGNYLTVFFPDQQTFLIGKIWFSLASSILLVLVIIGIFGYALYTILTQKKISEIKNDFINNMTHEFKTPISTVSLACEALQDEEVKKNETFLKRYISIIQAENKRLGLQVEKVLQMATLEKKDFKLKLERLDLHHVIERALENINIQIEKRAGVINKQLVASSKEVVADEVHLTNIIYNLLDNANKYSRDKPEITIATENKNGGIVLRITDKGIGMSKEVLNRIFEKFYREPTGNIHDVKGFGLGLTYVRTMLDALGGTIGVKSDVTKGSTFEIYLPQNG